MEDGQQWQQRAVEKALRDDATPENKQESFKRKEEQQIVFVQ